MNKEDFFERLQEALESFTTRGYSPAGLRLSKNSCPFNPLWTLWIVGPGSLDETLVMATDSWFVSRYKSPEKAEKELLKYRRWFKEWQK